MDPLAAVACADLGPCDAPAVRDAAIPGGGTPITTIRLSIHVFCENNGGNCAATQADVSAAVARLNADYALWRIQFIYESNFVNKTQYRYLSPSEEFGMKNAYANSPATKLNVYVVSTSSGGNWGTFPWDPDALVKQGGIVMNQTPFVAGSFVFTHEVGHCLGLWHVFHGVDEVPVCGDCYEAAGRSPEEGDITGDRCSDTNPTPRNDGQCFDPPGTDPCNGNPWVDTPFLNYMGYSYTCPVEFTPQQAGRMQCWIGDVLAGWVQLLVPPNAPGTPTLTKIGGGEIQIVWSDNSNDEDGFRVEREKKSGGSWIDRQTIADLGENTTLWWDAPGSGTFRYRVLAYNAIGESASGWKQIQN